MQQFSCSKKIKQLIEEKSEIPNFPAIKNAPSESSDGAESKTIQLLR